MDRMRVGSTFSGVGGIDLGLERAGMQVVFQCEADAWCRGILAQHWPGVPCYEDVRDVRRSRSLREPTGRGSADAVHAAVDDGRGEAGAGLPDSVDLLCGGFPCQDLSVAGRRRGLAGERSGLFFELARIADELVRPGGWFLAENVPGLLSSEGGRDFAVVVRTLGDIGFHDIAWRVLDSRYFGVPQRRRRVFIVGRRAVGAGAREVLLEPESGGGNFAPGREARTGVAGSPADGARSTHALTVGVGRRLDGDTEGFVAFHATQDPISGDAAPSLGANASIGVVSTLQGGSGRRGHRIDAEGAAGGLLQPTERIIAGTLDRMRGGPDDNSAQGWHDVPTALTGSALDAYGVRASPGLPRRVDDPRPDGPRYAAMGNAVTVNVAEWIGRRIVAWEQEHGHHG